MEPLLHSYHTTRSHIAFSFPDRPHAQAEETTTATRTLLGEARVEAATFQEQLEEANVREAGLRAALFKAEAEVEEKR